MIFGATHLVQQPGSHGTSSVVQREFMALLARAAMAVGVDGLFMEVQPNPEQALSDDAQYGEAVSPGEHAVSIPSHG